MRPNRFWTRSAHRRGVGATWWFGLALLCLIAASPGFAQTRPTPDRASTPTGDAEMRREIQQLRRTAMSREPEPALEAIDALAELGEPANDARRAALTQQINRYDRMLRAGVRRMVERDRLAGFEEQLAAEREAAWTLIDKLQKKDIPQAREHYETLRKMWAELSSIYQRQAQLLQALRHRQAFAERWRDLPPPDDAGDAGDAPDLDDLDAELTEAIESAFDASADQAVRVVDFNDGKPAGPEHLRNLWLHLAAARIEEYNQTHRDAMSRGEWRNLQMVNAYRLTLGTLPYEADPRLIQAARRHSKEMVDLGYFAHESPNAENKTHTKRMANAGYKGGYSENIAQGSGDGEGAFWQWFGSPPHHQNMVNRGSTALGVGQWGNHWTQNMGRGKRLMSRSEEDRAAIEVKGEVLPPFGR